MNARFLLDELFSPVIAEQLAALSIDTGAVASWPELRTLPDPDILEAAASEGRILVTRNVGDFVRLDAIWGSSGRSHPGILCVATRKFPEDSSLVGNLTNALADWAAYDGNISGTHWFL